MEPVGAHADHAAPVAAVAERLEADLDRGLSEERAAALLDRHGPNELERSPQPHPGRILLDQLTSPMILILIGAGVLSAALGDVTEAVVIFVVVALNAWIGFRQEYRAERAIASLQAMATPTTTVTRAARAAEIPARELVAGDLVQLGPGSMIPADGRIVEAHALRVEESALTGESAPVDKHPDPVAAEAELAARSSMVYSGTSVAAGRGTVLVTATGMRAELGRVAELLRDAESGKTPLQQRLDALVRRLGVAAAATVALVFMIELARGEPLDTLLLSAVSLAVAAIPEGLPAVVTIALTLGAQRMLRRRALIRRLNAVETLGSVTMICSDKTGTLTENRMTVDVLDVAGDRRDLTDADRGHRAESRSARDAPTLTLLLAGGALCNDAVRSPRRRLRWSAIQPRRRSSRWPTASASTRTTSTRVVPRVAEVPFDPERKRMTTLHALPTRAEEVPRAAARAVRHRPHGTARRPHCLHQGRAGRAAAVLRSRRGRPLGSGARRRAPRPGPRRRRRARPRGRARARDRNAGLA